MTGVWDLQRAANRLVKLAEVFSAVPRLMDRFPVEVPPLAMEAARIFGWSDPITEVQAANIKGFDGALFPGDGRKDLLYNEAVSSPDEAISHKPMSLALHPAPTTQRIVSSAATPIC